MICSNLFNLISSAVSFQQNSRTFQFMFVFTQDCHGGQASQQSVVTRNSSHKDFYKLGNSLL